MFGFSATFSSLFSSSSTMFSKGFSTSTLSSSSLEGISAIPESRTFSSLPSGVDSDYANKRRSDCHQCQIMTRRRIFVP